MELFPNSYDLNLVQWMLVIFCGMLTGMSKTGLSGVGLFIVPVFAAIFGGKPSTGLVLPMLVTADIFAVTYYNRHAHWKYVLALLPWACAGIAAGVLTGRLVSDRQFSHILSVVVIAGIMLMIWQDLKKKNMMAPDYWWFAALLGLAGGFATMVGNAAGPVMALYLLSMRLPKNVYIGTGAWFFFIINLVKVPLHVFVWKTISLQSLMFDAVMIPGIIAGAFLGIQIVKVIPEKPYRIFIIVSTLIAALALLI